MRDGLVAWILCAPFNAEVRTMSASPTTATITPAGPHAFGPSRRLQLLGGGCAVATTGVLAAALLGLFDQASPQRWLAPSGELRQLAGACLALPDQAERLQCTQAVVAAWRERHTLVAMHDQPR